MTQGHKNEVGDRVLIALMTEKGKKTFAQCSLFVNEILLWCIIAKGFKVTQSHRNELGDRVSIALITEKGRNTFTQGSLFDTRFYYGALLQKESRSGQSVDCSDD